MKMKLNEKFKLIDEMACMYVHTYMNIQMYIYLFVCMFLYEWSIYSDVCNTRYDATLRLSISSNQLKQLSCQIEHRNNKQAKSKQ